MYQRQSRLSKSQQRRLIEYFVVGTTARGAAALTGVQANTAAQFFLRLRRLIASQLPSYELTGKIEVDESYFGGKRKGKRGRGAAGKVAVFGLLKRQGKVFTAIIPDAKSTTLIPLIKEHISLDSIIYTDTFSAYDALDVDAFEHHRINHTERFAEDDNHINGIENFWRQAKRHLHRFNGIKRKYFYFYLKECEWRFNFGGYQSLLLQLKHWYQKAKH
jgi:transposase